MKYLNMLDHLDVRGVRGCGYHGSGWLFCLSGVCLCNSQKGVRVVLRHAYLSMFYSTFNQHNKIP